MFCIIRLLKPKDPKTSLHNFYLCDSTYLYARFQSNPQESYPRAVKRILCYLVGTTNQSLFYKKNQDFVLVG